MSWKGLTYEQIHGEEKAAELRESKKTHFTSFDTGAHTRGKTYEEIYGPERAAELREVRRKAMIGNKRSGPSRKVICEVCGHEFSARGMGTHKQRCERAKQYIPVRRCILCEEWISYYGTKSFCASCNDFIDEEYGWDAWSLKTSLINIAESVRPGYREKYRKATVKRFQDNPEQHPNRLVAGLGRSKDDCTKYQWSLYEMVSRYHPCEFNHYVKCNGSGRYVDVAIKEFKLGFEYDGGYWHQNELDDYNRDKELNEVGWTIVHINKNVIMSQIVAEIMQNYKVKMV